MSDKILDPRKFWDLKNVGSQKFEFEKIYDPKRFSITENFVSQKFIFLLATLENSQLLTKLAQVRSVSSNLSSKLS